MGGTHRLLCVIYLLLVSTFIRLGDLMYEDKSEILSFCPLEPKVIPEPHDPIRRFWRPSICLSFSGVQRFGDARGQHLNCMPQDLRIEPSTAKCITENFEYMLKLKDDIFKNYSVGILPVRNQSIPVVTTMGLYLIMIQSLNMKNQILTTSGWLKFSWRDEFLRWNPDDYGGIKEMILFQSEVWLPDVFLENTAQYHRELGTDHMLISVLSTGMVHWEPGIITETSCAVDITKYPFDSQTCEIRFLTWMHTNRTIIVLPEFTTVNLDALLPNGEWDIISSMAQEYRYPSSYRLGTDHTGVTFVLQLYRKRFFYILNTLIPVMLLSTLNVLVFILPSDCGERMALAVTVLLAFTVYLSIISENIPKTSEDTSILTIHLTVLLGLSTASVVCAGIVLNIHFRDPQRTVPHCLISFFGKMCLEDHKLMSERRRPSVWSKRMTIRDQIERRSSEHKEGPISREKGGHKVRLGLRESVKKQKRRRSQFDNLDASHYEQSKPLVPPNSPATAQCQQTSRSEVEIRNEAREVMATTKAAVNANSRANKDSKDDFEQLLTQQEDPVTDPATDGHPGTKKDIVNTTENETAQSPVTHTRFSVAEEDQRPEPVFKRHRADSPRLGSKKSILAALSNEIQKMLEERRRTRRESEITWHDIGTAMDRFLFWVFLFATGSVNITILFLLAY